MWTCEFNAFMHGLLLRCTDPSAFTKVFCKDCYDNRKSTAKSSTANFRRDPQNSRKMLCAVADCNSDASMKQSWVGLFL